MTLQITDGPEYWRQRAEEARAVAVQMADAHTKATMLGIAQAYDKLAEQSRAAHTIGRPMPRSPLSARSDYDLRCEKTAPAAPSMHAIRRPNTM
jgi:hypothetical protein